jgi:hypothetical protein
VIATTGVAAGGAGGLAYLLGYLSLKDLLTLNWADVKRNVPAARCLIDCPEVQLLENPGAYAILDPHKVSANPVLDSTSVSNVQAYPSSIIRVDEQYYATTGSWPQTLGFKSPNGTEWKEANQNLVPRGESGSFDSHKTTAQVFRYTPDSEKYHILYRGLDSDGVSRFGHAYSDQPLDGYDKNEENNPILSSDVEMEFDDISNILSIAVSDFVVVDDEPIYFGSGVEAGTQTSFIWMGTGKLGDEIKPTTVLFTDDDDELRVRSDPDPESHPSVGTPTVIRVADRYIMAYSSLADVEGHEQATAQGKIYAAVGDRPDDIFPTNDLLLETGECNSWEELRVYQPRWLKRQDGTYTKPDLVDGNIRLYYSGHDCGASKFFGNRGLTGVAEYPLSNLRSYSAET